MVETVRHPVCRLDELPVGTSRIVEAEGRSVGVFNVGGELFAYRNVCPHQKAPICRGVVTGTMLPSEPGTFDYGLEDAVIRCPWHNWEFDLRTGKSLFTGDKRRLGRLVVKVEADTVYIEMKVYGADAAR